MSNNPLQDSFDKINGFDKVESEDVSITSSKQEKLDKAFFKEELPVLPPTPPRQIMSREEAKALFNKISSDTEDKDSEEEREALQERINNIVVDRSRVGEYPDGVNVINWKTLSNENKAIIDRELNKDNKGHEICNKNIPQAYVRNMLSKNTEGIILRYQNKSFGFMFYEIRADGEKYIDLICVKKPPNTFRGYRFGKKLIQVLAMSPNTTMVTLEAVEPAVDFYLSIGFELDDEDDLLGEVYGLVPMTFQ